MKPLSAFILSLLTVVFVTVMLGQNTNGKISSELEYRLKQKPTNSPLTVWIYFTEKKYDNEKDKPQLPQRTLQRRAKHLNGDLVTVYDYPLNSEYLKQIEPYCLKIRHQSRWLNAVSAEVLPGTIESLAILPFVKKIGLVHKFKKDTPQLQSIDISAADKKTIDYGFSWIQNQQIEVPFLHSLGFTGQNILICMMDAGYNNLSHPAFQQMNIIATYDFVNNNPYVHDTVGNLGTGNHGTLTLSAIGGYDPGKLIGPAFQASYILTKTENTESETQVEEDNWIAALEWAELNFGPDITSTSLGYRDYDDGSTYSNEQLNGNTAPITIAGDIAASLGILVVNSAGNSGPKPTTIIAPADGDSVMAVGAVSSDGVLADFSSRGPTGDGRIKPDVAAMGVMTVSASPFNQDYVYASGTSLSCPLVAGGAAILWQAFPQITNMQLFNALKITASYSFEPNNNYGWGIINLRAAYNFLSEKPHIAHIPPQAAFLEPNTTGYPIECKIFSPNQLPTNTPRLHYRINQGDWISLLMQLSGDKYTVLIPGIQQNATVDYFFSLDHGAENITLPYNAPVSYFTFNVQSLGITANDDFQITVRPNPATTMVNITVPQEFKFGEAYLYDTGGNLIREIKITDCNFPINVENLASGPYLLKIIQKRKSIITKVMKQ